MTDAEKKVLSRIIEIVKLTEQTLEVSASDHVGAVGYKHIRNAIAGAGLLS